MKRTFTELGKGEAGEPAIRRKRPKTSIDNTSELLTSIENAKKTLSKEKTSDRDLKSSRRDLKSDLDRITNLIEKAKYKVFEQDQENLNNHINLYENAYKAYETAKRSWGDLSTQRNAFDDACQNYLQYLQEKIGKTKDASTSTADLPRSDSESVKSQFEGSEEHLDLKIAGTAEKMLKKLEREVQRLADTKERSGPVPVPESSSAESRAMGASKREALQIRGQIVAFGRYLEQAQSLVQTDTAKDLLTDLQTDTQSLLETLDRQPQNFGKEGERKAETTVPSYKNREQIPEKYKWDLSTAFASDEAWEKAFKSVEERLPELGKLEGTLGESGQALLKAWHLENEIHADLSQLYGYVGRRYDEDTNNTHYQEMKDRANTLYDSYDEATCYKEPETLAIPEEQLKQFMQQTPGLELYRHSLDELNRRRPHILPPDIEKAVITADSVMRGPEKIFKMMCADLNFLPKIRNEQGEEVQLTEGDYSGFRASPEPRIRREAFEALHKTYDSQRNSFAEVLATEINVHLADAKQHNYETCRESALSINNIPESVYDTLIETVKRQLIPVFNRYQGLLKRTLNLGELHIYDLYTPLGKQTKDDRITYQGL